MYAREHHFNDDKKRCLYVKFRSLEKGFPLKKSWIITRCAALCKVPCQIEMQKAEPKHHLVLIRKFVPFDELLCARYMGKMKTSFQFDSNH